MIIWFLYFILKSFFFNYALVLAFDVVFLPSPTENDVFTCNLYTFVGWKDDLFLFFHYGISFVHVI